MTGRNGPRFAGCRRSRTILEILSRRPPEKILARLAAGPLEDLIHYHGPEIIAEMEAPVSLQSRIPSLARRRMGKRYSRNLDAHPKSTGKGLV
jgi:hypothetical protein